MTNEHEKRTIKARQNKGNNMKLERRNHNEHPLQPDEMSRRVLGPDVLGPDSVCRGIVMTVLRNVVGMTDEQIATYASTTVEDVQQAIDRATR